MRKQVIVYLLLVLCAAFLSACGCEHVWNPATCTEPEICEACGETQGEASGHSWLAATCSQPETCETCGETQGKALGHQWYKATCTDPKTCGACGETQGEALGHNWNAPTCTKPATCYNCSASGDPALGHDYVKNICSRCEDKLIEDHKDLQSYLNKNFRTIHTAIGDVKSLSYEIQVNDPNYWSTCDFEIQIDSILWCDELDSTIDYAVFYGDFLPYDDRIQAVADILDFEMSIIRLAEDAFPDAKFSVSFYDWGYEYPNIKVGFVSTSKLIWRNFKYNNTGQSGYAATSLCKWEAVQGDFLDYLYSDFDKWKQIFADIEDIRPEYNLNF